MVSLLQAQLASTSAVTSHQQHRQYPLHFHQSFEERVISILSWSISMLLLKLSSFSGLWVL